MSADEHDAEARHAVEVLRRRALALSRVETEEHRGGLVSTVVVLQIAAEKLGIPITSVRELTPLRQAADIGGLPQWCRGIVQVRGDILSVLDLHQWLSLAGASTPRYLAVLEARAGAIAVLVDAVLDVRAVYQDDIATTFAAGPGRGRKGVTRDLVTLLDVTEMLDADDLIVDQEPEQAE